MTTIFISNDVPCVFKNGEAWDCPTFNDKIYKQTMKEIGYAPRYIKAKLNEDKFSIYNKIDRIYAFIIANDYCAHNEILSNGANINIDEDF